ASAANTERTEPCGNCDEAGKPCEYRELDKKRRPVSAKYVAELEDRVAYLESFITKIREAAPQDRASLLDIPEFADHLQSDPSKEPRVQSPPEVISPHPDNLEPDPEGSLIYHGPTSIIHGKLRRSITIAGSAPRYDMPPIQPSPDGNFEQIAEHFGISMNNDLVTSALMLFFKWQYP
ncbi:hypothetical protein ACHAQI_012025, partial [Fusarium lateritium]